MAHQSLSQEPCAEKVTTKEERRTACDKKEKNLRFIHKIFRLKVSSSQLVLNV
jgi:hypothetical protein